MNVIRVRAAKVQVQADPPFRPSVLTSGARRAFFCRMKHSRGTGKHDDEHLLPSTSKKKGENLLSSVRSVENVLVRCGSVDEADRVSFGVSVIHTAGLKLAHRCVNVKHYFYENM